MGHNFFPQLASKGIAAHKFSRWVRIVTSWAWVTMGLRICHPNDPKSVCVSNIWNLLSIVCANGRASIWDTLKLILRRGLSFRMINIKYPHICYAVATRFARFGFILSLNLEASENSQNGSATGVGASLGGHVPSLGIWLPGLFSSQHGELPEETVQKWIQKPL